MPHCLRSSGASMTPSIAVAVVDAATVDTATAQPPVRKPPGTKKAVRKSDIKVVVTGASSQVREGAASSESGSVKKSKDSSLGRQFEQTYLARHRYVIGVDEAGRGPLAGPVVAAACIVDTCHAFSTETSRATSALSHHLPEEALAAVRVMDSKATTEKGRELAYQLITNTPGVYWGLSRVQHDEIDQLNILQASLTAMRRAVEDLLTRNPFIDPADCIVLVDGNKLPEGLPTAAAEFVIKGDSLVYSIAAASIIAKVDRDSVMLELHDRYPLYNLAKHKGYPTKEHRDLLLKHGPSAIHRYSYRPVAEAAARHGVAFTETGASILKAEKRKRKTVSGAEELAAISIAIAEDGPSSIPVKISSDAAVSQERRERRGAEGGAAHSTVVVKKSKRRKQV